MKNIEYYDGPVKDSGRTLEEINESIEREKKRLAEEEMKEKKVKEKK